MNKTLLLPFIAFCVSFVGCAFRDDYPPPPRYINTPTFCNISMPDKPELDDGAFSLMGNFTKLLVYKDELEMALHCCRGDEVCITKKGG